MLKISAFLRIDSFNKDLHHQEVDLLFPKSMVKTSLFPSKQILVAVLVFVATISIAFQGLKDQLQLNGVASLQSVVKTLQVAQLKRTLLILALTHTVIKF